jgi:hypothetical protein
MWWLMINGLSRERWLKKGVIRVVYERSLLFIITSTPTACMHVSTICQSNHAKFGFPNEGPKQLFPNFYLVAKPQY